MRLLLDSVPVRGPGLLRLRRELAVAAGSRAPQGASVILSARVGDDLPRETGVRVERCAGLRWGWPGLWHWYHRGLPRLAQRLDADVVYSLSGIVSAPLVKRCGVVTTINNMIPFTPAVLREYSNRSLVERLRYRQLLRRYVRSVELADAVVLHSRHALEAVTRYAGDAVSSKTEVALTGVPSDVVLDPAHPPAHPRDGKPYFFYFSAVRPYKNHHRLLEAYRMCLTETEHLPDLVFAGLPTDRSYVRSLEQRMRDPRLSGRVRYVGALPRQEIPAWLHHAEANLFPSLCETNSVVLAEILALAAPLACSDLACNAEICGDAAVFFDPENPRSMSAVLVRLAADPALRASLRARAAARAQQLTWEPAGDAIWAAARRAQSALRSRRSATT